MFSKGIILFHQTQTPDKAATQAPISDEDKRNFMQLVAQAQLALQMR